MSNMQHVKKMVLIPYDEYNCWKDCKKLGVSSPAHSDSVGSISVEHGHAPTPESDNHSDKSEDQPATINELQKQLISKVGSTLLDLLVTKGTKGVLNLIGRGESEPYPHLPPPPGQPDANKKKRNLEEEKEDLPSSAGPAQKQVRSEAVDTIKTVPAGKVTWKTLR